MAMQLLPDGTEIFFERKGRGRAVVLLHGVWASSRFFKKQIDALSSEFDVTALDFRGHGRSSKTVAGHTVSQYAEDLFAFLGATKSEEVILVGWSMGAFVTWQYLQQFGAKHVSGVVIVDQSASDFQWPGWNYGVFDFNGLREIMMSVQTKRRELALGFASSMFKEKPSEEDITFLADEVCKVPEAIAGCIFFDQAVRDYRAQLSSITVPTLLCFGRASKPFPVEAGQDLAQRISGAKLIVFEESGHCPFWEESSRFNEEVSRFLMTVSHVAR